MKYCEHHPEVKVGLKCLLIYKLNQKAGGHVLMTKFSKSKKIGPPISYFGLSDFDSFRAKPRKKLNSNI
jgi:hypothetical protein